MVHRLAIPSNIFEKLYVVQFRSFCQCRICFKSPCQCSCTEIHLLLITDRFSTRGTPRENMSKCYGFDTPLLFGFQVFICIGNALVSRASRVRRLFRGFNNNDEGNLHDTISHFHSPKYRSIQ